MSSNVCELTGNSEHDYCSECGTCHTCLDLENDSLAEKNKQLNIALTKANNIIERYKLDLQDVKAANKNLYAECKQYQGELVQADKKCNNQLEVLRNTSNLSTARLEDLGKLKADLANVTSANKGLIDELRDTDKKYIKLQQKYSELEDKQDMISHVSSGWLSKHDEKLQQAISLLEQVYIAG